MGFPKGIQLSAPLQHGCVSHRLVPTSVWAGQGNSQKRIHATCGHKILSMLKKLAAVFKWHTLDKAVPDEQTLALINIICGDEQMLPFETLYHPTPRESVMQCFPWSFHRTVSRSFCCFWQKRYNRMVHCLEHEHDSSVLLNIKSTILMYMLQFINMDIHAVWNMYCKWTWVIDMSLGRPTWSPWNYWIFLLASWSQILCTALCQPFALLHKPVYQKSLLQKACQNSPFIS